MALVLADRIKETTTTTGTGPYTLRGAETGFEAFSTIGDTNTTYYCCTDGVDFEIGLGTFTSSGTVLARTTILQSSNSDAAFSWANGTRTIFCTQPAEKAVFLDANGNLPITNSATVGGSLGVTGSIEGSSTLAITGNATVGGTLGITGVATFTAVPLFPNNTIETADIQADAITGAKIVDNAINSEHYTDGSIDTAHIANLQITTALIAADAVTSAKIPDNAIDSEHYTDGSIDLAHMSVNSIDSDQYVDASIDTAHIGNLQITTALIAADAVNGDKIADNAIDSEHYTDGSIDTAHIADSQITVAKMAANSIDSDQYVDASIDTAHIANLQITTGLIAADAITAAKIADDVINSEHYAAGSIDTEHIADANVTLAKIANQAANTVLVRDANSSGVVSAKALTTTQILIGDGTGFTAAALSGDATMTNGGVVTIANNAVTLAKLDGIARGKFIVGDASGNPSVIGPGTNGQILTSDGTDIAFATSSAASLDDATALAIALG